jgi:phospholipase A1/A2
MLMAVHPHAPLCRPAYLFTAIIMVVFCNSVCFGQFAEISPTLQACIQEKVLAAPETMTVGEIKIQCQELESTLDLAAEEDTTDAAEHREEIEAANVLRPFTLMAHRQNYILLAAYNFQGYDTEEFSDAFGGEDFSFKSTESQFQLSFKAPLAVNLFDKNIDIFAAYTARSFWQVYQKDISSPFRETNHQPEVWLDFHPELTFYGFRSTASALGVAHQSNGRSGNLSRSWNTVFADLAFQNGNFFVSMRPWVRIPESTENDDNPDLTDYLGHGELRFAYKYNKNVFSLMSRNNLESGFSKGAVEVGWSFPIPNYPYFKGYLQYFSGYGESLIDYDRYVNRIGIGFLFTDIL